MSKTLEKLVDKMNASAVGEIEYSIALQEYQFQVYRILEKECGHDVSLAVRCALASFRIDNTSQPVKNSKAVIAYTVVKYFSANKENKLGTTATYQARQFWQLPLLQIIDTVALETAIGKAFYENKIEINRIF